MEVDRNDSARSHVVYMATEAVEIAERIRGLRRLLAHRAKVAGIADTRSTAVLNVAESAMNEQWEMLAAWLEAERLSTKGPLEITVDLQAEWEATFDADPQNDESPPPLEG